MVRPGYPATRGDGRDADRERREQVMSDTVRSSDVPRSGRGERGAVLVEFAISSVLLLLLLFGIIEYGYVLSFKQGLTQAAAEGARAAAVGKDPADAVK